MVVHPAGILIFRKSRDSNGGKSAGKGLSQQINTFGGAIAYQYLFLLYAMVCSHLLGKALTQNLRILPYKLPAAEKVFLQPLRFTA